MALTVASSTEMTVSAAAASHTISKPAGTVTNDFLVAVHHMAPAGSLAAMTPGAGWTVLAEFSNAAGHNRIYEKFAGAGEPATWAFGGSASAHSKITVLRVVGVTGALRRNIWQGGSAGAGTSHASGTYEQISYSTDALKVAAFGGPVGGSANTWTAPFGHTAHGTLAQGAQQYSHLVTSRQLGFGGFGFATATSSLSFSGATGDLNLSLLISQPRVPQSGPGLFTKLLVEAQFDGSTWEDISDDVAGEVKIRHGRATRFTDITPSVLEMVLRSPDGRYMPDNPNSPHYPYIVENVPVMVTAERSPYIAQRFFGLIRSWQPLFPDGSVGRAVTRVTATDFLGTLATFKMPSSWINSARYTASQAGTRYDTFVMDGDGDATVYLDNVTDSAGTKARAKTVPATDRVGSITFGNADGLSIEASAKFNPAQSGAGGIIRVDTTGNTIRCLVFWVKFPRRVQSASGNTVDVLHFYDATNTVSYGSLRLTLDATHDDLGYFNSGGTFVGPAPGSDVGNEKWTMVTVETVTATPTTTRIRWHNLDSVGGPSMIASFDLRNVRHLWFGGLGGDVAEMEVSGITTWGLESGKIGNPQEGLTGGSPWNASNRIGALNLVLPYEITEALGSNLVEPVVTGNWHDRTALEVANEIARSADAIIFQNPHEQDIWAIGSNLQRQAGVAMTFDAEEDLLAGMTLARGVETRPTRILVEFPTGKATVIDAAAEVAAGGEQRLQSVKTTLTDFPSAESLATALLSRVSQNAIEISQVSVDVETSANNIAESLCEYSQPGTRVRLTGLPVTHFGASDRDAWIEGWTEHWDPIGGCRFVYDLTAVPVVWGLVPSDFLEPSNVLVPRG